MHVGIGMVSSSDFETGKAQACEADRSKNWRLFWIAVAVVVGLILLLPVKLITTGHGLPEPWFIGYLAFAVAAFSFIAVQLIKKRCGPVPTMKEALSGRREVYTRRREDEVELPEEDVELLNSIRELMEWFEEGKMTGGRYRNYRERLAEMERWLRTGIKKDIEIRNLRKELKKLREEVELLKASQDGRERE